MANSDTIEYWEPIHSRALSTGTVNEIKTKMIRWYTEGKTVNRSKVKQQLDNETRSSLIRFLTNTNRPAKKLDRMGILRARAANNYREDFAERILNETITPQVENWQGRWKELGLSGQPNWAVLSSSEAEDLLSKSAKGQRVSAAFFLD